MINVDKEFFTERVISGYSKFSPQSGIPVIDPAMVVEFKLGNKFVYKLNNHHPDTKVLLKVQERLVANFLSNIPLNGAAKAYVVNKSYLDFLEPHRNNYYFMRVDLKNFFHSISKKLIRDSFGSYFSDEFLDEKMKQRVLNGFVNLVTYQVPKESKNKVFSGKSILPMGFKTSPVISNIIFRKIDIIIEDYCSQNDIIYTRYADDMLFSSKSNSESIDLSLDFILFGKSKNKKFSFLHTDRFIQEISLIVNVIGFKLNKKKTVKATNTLSLNGYTIEGTNYSDGQGSIRISNKKTYLIGKLIHELEQHKTAEVIMTKLFDFKVSDKYFNYKPIKKEHVERYCKDQILNKLVGYRSYLISILKYDEKYYCIDKKSTDKYNKLISDIERLVLSIQNNVILQNN
ncbi:RNA-directed DNA polymerase [Shewanella abyssi]|uniref:reverse transcriptase domain-containing protein n=1 Tax=Shewanella abyssi TaxID=311789 RepID=UPI00200C309B|nr:reverse transcriptase domain-containing protein [Shewanella abyssi]MCL1049842.1 RNA-directed DNA polymerase [Shewanella abyssi]